MSHGLPRVKRGRGWLVVLLAVVQLGCLTAAPPKPPPSRPQSPDDLLRRALTRTRDDAGARQTLRLAVECFLGDDYLTLELFGSGVGIWNGARQFTAGGAGIEAAVEELLAAGFPEMAASYGGDPGREPPRPRSAPPGAGPVRLLCAVEAAAGGVTKRVEQLAGGERHAPLVELAERLLGRWRAAGEAGTGAAALDDGLAKLARGDLAPETLALTLHEKPEPGGEDGAGFLLRLHGRRLTTRAFAPGGGYGPERSLVLSLEEVARLAASLAELAPGRLPVNLWAPGYLDLTLELLDHRLSLQARRFAGMARDTHGAAQRDFERLLELLRELYRRLPDGC